MENLTALTERQIKGVKEEILNTQMKLSKELAYSKDLQNKKRIKELKTHVAHLRAMILNGWNAPKFN